MRSERQFTWAVVVPVQPATPPVSDRKYCGDGRDIVLQGFHWHSHRGAHEPHSRQHKSWYRVLAESAAPIKAAGFTWVWFPPASDSLAPEGYMPRRWYVFDTPYGSEQELRAALQALEPVRAMADVVLNHRVGAHTPGADFADPPFRDNRAAVVRDDESGVGTGNCDTGERHPAGRDLDHTNPDVRATIKEYLGRLKGLGFRGFRYDLTKGYHGRFTGEYNDAVGPDLSIGEFFDRDRQKVTNWLDATGGKSTAFDFPTRYLLWEACTSEDYGRLRSYHNGRAVPGGLLGYWPSRSVTFLDNHDTEYRRETEHQYNGDGTRHFAGKTVDMGYAYTLTHPGIPSVFWPHFFDWGAATQERIRRLMQLRQQVGIHSRSHVEIKEASRGLYAALIDDRVAMKLGARHWHPGHGWHLVVDGERHAVWTRS